MSKGSRRRPTQISDLEAEANWREVFGERGLPTVMSEEERQALEAERERLIAGEDQSNGEQT